jgi:hypothetical protein
MTLTLLKGPAPADHGRMPDARQVRITMPETALLLFWRPAR